MDKKDINELKKIYERYGFEHAKSYDNDQVIVFTIKTGYFDNADVVTLNDDVDSFKAFDDFSKAGFACTVRPIRDNKQAELQLFKGFFSIDSIRTRLEFEYEKFTKSIVTPFSNEAQYEYINAPYLVNGLQGSQSPAQEVASRLNEQKPTLFLIEAAAGFGKTCTAYELVHLLIKQGDFLPLFSELSRNRQAAIFRYILLDEIDRTFPILNSRLVQTEMKNGRVITILDGFDELLRKSEDGGDFENKEPMLETIGEFLKDNAKIVLTTRRTILFEGDAFHAWVESHTEEFSLVRIRISEPHIKNWLSESRLIQLENAGLQIEEIANPVLLSYLRYISNENFEKVSSDPHKLVDTYFNFMLNREITRQDLRLSEAKQQEVLRSIADDMITYGYTSEYREYIVDHILHVNSTIIDEALLGYSAAEKPTKEEIANKLASHALLDRSQREPNKIGFVNEFVLGHFVAMIILESKEFLSDDIRFIEPAVVSYKSRSNSSKIKLWEKLNDSTEFMEISDRVDIALSLVNSIPFDLFNNEIIGLEISNINIGKKLISNSQFNDCIFKECDFDLSNIENTTFLNCKYYNNSFSNTKSMGPIYVFGAYGDQEFIEELINSNDQEEQIEPDEQLLLERFILEKFWPVGRDIFVHKHRPIKGVCVNGGIYNNDQLYSAIYSLKKKEILIVPQQTAFIEINIDKILEIREILGRDTSNGK